jgi:hypothetical protein
MAVSPYCKLLSVSSTMMRSRTHRKRWNASTRMEIAKLSASEGDWKLPGLESRSEPLSRTRHSGSGRPNLTRRYAVSLSSSSSSDLVGSSCSSISSHDSDFTYHASDDSEVMLVSCSEEERSSDEEGNDATAPKILKPEPTRVIVEVEGLISTLEMNSYCMQCNKRVHASL